MKEHQATTVLPGVNFTRAGIIMVNLRIWALLKIHRALQLPTTTGSKVIVVYRSLSRNEADKIKPLEIAA